MTPKDNSASDTTIADIHRVREQMAAEFNGDLFAIAANLQKLQETSGCEVITRPLTSNDPSTAMPGKS